MKTFPQNKITMLLDLISLPSKLTFINLSTLDYTERFSAVLTPMIITVCSLLTTFKQYILQSISCYFIGSPSGGVNVAEYVENFCWVEGTRSINLSTIPSKEQLLRYEVNKYYQFVPFVLSFQAIICLIPALVSTSLSNNLKRVLSLARKIEDGSSGNLDKVVDRFMDLRERRCCYHFFLTLFVKVLYLGMYVGQLALINKYLSDHRIFFGIELLMDLSKGRTWTFTQVFPRVGFCLVDLRNVGSTQTLIAQCALPANMINEKIYIFIWLWFLVGFCLTVLGFIPFVLKVCLKLSEWGSLDGALIANKIAYHDNFNLGKVREAFHRRLFPSTF